MLKPIVDSVIEKAPSRYALVIGVAKRARSIVEKAQHEGEILVEKPVGIAVEQLLNHEYEIVELTPEEIAAQEAAQAAAQTAAKAAAEAAAQAHTESVIDMNADDDDVDEDDSGDEFPDDVTDSDAE